MSRVIRTVLGDIDPATAGSVDSHDHLFLATPALPGEELDDEEEAATALRGFSTAGGGTLVQWTPRGLHRELAALRRISASTGINVVAATGRHRTTVYPRGSAEPGRTVDGLAEAFVRDITEKSCGLIKIGISHETVTAVEADALQAASVAHHATGVPIAIHLEQGSASDLVLNALREDGVPARSIVLGHLGKNPDLNAIVDAARSGAWLCLDTPSPGHQIEIAELGQTLEALVQNGHRAQLLLGADTTQASARSDPTSYGPAALLTRVVPQLVEKLGTDIVTSIIVANPALCWSRQPR